MRHNHIINLLLIAILMLSTLSAAGNGFRYKRFTTSDGLPGRNIEGLVVDPNGTLWIGTWRGLAYYDGKFFRQVEFTDTSLAALRVNQMQLTQDRQHIWYTDVIGKEYLADIRTRQARAVDAGEQQFAVATRCPVNHSIDSLGLHLAYGKNKIDIPYSITIYAANPKYIVAWDEPNKLLWVSFDDALYQIAAKAEPYTYYMREEGSASPLYNGEVRAMLHTADGHLLVANKNTYVYQYDSLRNLTGFLHPDGIIRKAKVPFGYKIYSMVEDSTGGVWMGGRESGLIYLPADGSPMQRWTKDMGILRANDIFHIAVEGETIRLSLWEDGVMQFVYQGGKLTVDAMSTEKQKMRATFRLDAKRLLACTQSGLYVYGNDLQTLQHPTVYDVSTVVADTRHQCAYAATVGYGLMKVQLQADTVSATKVQVPGIPSIILAMTPTEDGRLWMATDNAMVSYNPDDNAVQTYDQQTFGVQMISFSEAFPIAWKNKWLWGTTLGYVEVDPAGMQITQPAAEEQGGMERWMIVLGIIVAAICLLAAGCGLRQRMGHRKPTALPAQPVIQEISPSAPVIPDADKDFVEQLRMAIEKHIDNEDLSVEMLAEELNTNRNILFRRTKETLNTTPAVLILDMRIKRAIQLLESKQYSVKEIACKVGFSDTNYFGKVFKQKTGYSPTKYPSS